MRVLVAARLSKLADGQTGLDSQDAESRTWALANGHQVVHVSADRKSGTVQPWDRPGLRPWVTDPAKLALYDAVVAYRLDRLSRGDNKSTNEIEKWAHDNGKLLLTVDGLRFPCEGADGIRWDVAKRIAHDEWLRNSERYKRMQGYLRGQGKLVGRPPFGYESVPAKDGHKMLAPTDEGREYVPQIYQRVAAGQSLDTVAAWLDTEGVAPVNSSRWWARSVGVIIRNPAYMGRRCEVLTVTDPQTGKTRRRYGRTIHQCEALVDAATWRKANDRLDGAPKRGPALRDNRAMLAGLVYCPRCGSPMYRIRCGSKRQNKVSYYRCAGSGPQRKGCGNMARLADVDRAVAGLITAPGLSRAPVKRLEFIAGTDYRAELDALRFDMAQLPLKGLTWDQEDAERARLRAEYDRLAALPSAPDRTEEVDTGLTFGQTFAALATDLDRNEFLRAQGFRAEVTREVVKLIQVRHPQRPAATVTLPAASAPQGG